MIQRIRTNWQTQGIPRCAAWFAQSNTRCRRLIWPWQRTGGNGESAEHYECMVRERSEWMAA